MIEQKLSDVEGSAAEPRKLFGFGKTVKKSSIDLVGSKKAEAKKGGWVQHIKCLKKSQRTPPGKCRSPGFRKGARKQSSEHHFGQAE